MYIYIYRLYCIDESIQECYIGSTNNITKRLKYHKSDCYNIKSKKYNYKLYTFIRAHGGWDNWLMEVIDEWDCEDGDKNQIEQLYIYTCEPELNSQKSHTTTEEIKLYYKQYYIKNKEKKKQYYIKNKDEINRKKREYYLKNKK